MKVIGFAGSSNSGKTTLIEQLIPALKEKGLRVSVIKHAHHKLEIDRPGKDTYRHREAGAFEVVAASPQRMVLMREFERTHEMSVHHLIGELYPGVDWVIIEGFKDADIGKIEVWSSEGTGAPLFELDPFVVAVATDQPDKLTESTQLPVFSRNDAAAIAQWMVDHGERFEYNAAAYD
ncbi:molybdopterin-guanine dinucleotide biosynthesis protein B [Hydrogenophaga sp. 5NK40-0174]|uniref:molybdopterin-guanine dinucleotide biosynthesis protein B n=1 Tax=Hydrogenophaga sp. 5NK40-0174 TaxID=3127649 RepID=UPI0031057C60